MDNVFGTVVASIQYRALADKASDAFYKLSNTRGQIQSYVFNDSTFEQKNDIAKAVEEELEKAMSHYGFETVQISVRAWHSKAESKYLSGLGIARQGQAIVDGLRDSVLAFSENVPGTSWIWFW
ncbi:hypothetical protein RchiOBHm_Chr7g0234121 [Rosa chinensis]|uniref:Band 7 domain-containing protein n=1 Tax=Rosa chinensis TaxID=74649 RepID=A0A2P6PGD5_ROSCH|nr:hypothetical protein RchiOBHm_Chr7g0234121 [Rosa chinensis]